MGKRLGNKGAVAISFQVGKTSLLFINAHFQAHHNNVKGRNKDYKMIEKQLTNAPSGKRAAMQSFPIMPPLMIVHRSGGEVELA